jgi:hypothetical protein
MAQKELVKVTKNILSIALCTHSLYVSYLFMLIVSFNIVGLPIVSKVLLVPMIVEMIISAYLYERRKGDDHE